MYNALLTELMGPYFLILRNAVAIDEPEPITAISPLRAVYGCPSA
jgi:hypothetical protein